MKPLDKLTELLCENERVKNNIVVNRKPNSGIEIFSMMNEKGGMISYNSLLERHLRMYCEDKNIYIKIDVDGMICEWQNLEPINIITTLDNTKDLYEQSDSVIERILDFLIKSKQDKNFEDIIEDTSDVIKRLKNK